MKKLFSTIPTVLTVIIVAVFFTAWLNVIPTFWRSDIMDAQLLFGLTVRTIITFLVMLVITITLNKHVFKVQAVILLAALLPVLAWFLHWLFYFDGPSDAVKQYPIFGIMLVWTLSLLTEAIILECKNKTLSTKNIFEDFMFSLSLSLLFYGVITLLQQKPFGGDTLLMSPILAVFQMSLCNSYHPHPVKE